MKGLKSNWSVPVSVTPIRFSRGYTYISGSSQYSDAGLLI